MVTTTATYSDSRYRASSGEGWDGVVRVSYRGLYSTGALLYDGRAVLTVAHLFSEDINPGQALVTFETSEGTTTLTANVVTLHPDYDAANDNHDLALVWLAPTPLGADRYALYRNSDEIGQAFTLVGYGVPGSGADGVIAQDGVHVRRLAENRFDAEAGDLKAALGIAMNWSPLARGVLVADFDDGSAKHDALGNMIGAVDLGKGLDEGLIAPGDSGGPAFLGGKLAGLASYTSPLVLGEMHPDIDEKSNSSFGEVGFWHRISSEQQWIDQSLRAAYEDAPVSATTVQKTIVEGSGGTKLVYFLLEFSGKRATPDALLSVDYATHDGTATAGSDYIACTGTLVLYPGENRAVIPVEVIGDGVSETDETFYMDVFHPVGGNFGPGVLTLTAMRTILNDDFV